jgi:hypothetical protein
MYFYVSIKLQHKKGKNMSILEALDTVQNVRLRIRQKKVLTQLDTDRDPQHCCILYTELDQKSSVCK